jgi:hypothetical protein
MVRVLGPVIPVAGGLGDQSGPDAVTLSSGGFTLTYRSDIGAGNDPFVTFYSTNNISAGSLDFDVLPNDPSDANIYKPALAPLAGNSVGVALPTTRHADGSADTSLNIVYVRSTTAGALGAALAVGDLNAGGGHDDLFAPAIATLSTGRQVVAFERNDSGFEDIFLNVVSADGLSTQFSAAAPLVVAGSADFQANPAVAAAANSALIAYEDATGTTTGSRNIVAQIFDGGSNTLGGPITIADHAAALFAPQVAALDDHRYVIVYSDGTDIWGKIYNTSNSSLSAEFEIDQPGGQDGAPAIGATANGGFIVVWDRAGGPGFDASIQGRRYDNNGSALGQQFFVAGPTASGPTVTVSGSNVLVAWTDTGPFDTQDLSRSVRGRVFSLTTPPDFNGNGVSDILWRSTGGGLAFWDIDQGGAIGGSGFVTSGGTPVAPDAIWSIAAISDFTADGRADLLWRNASGALALWTMNGSTIVSNSALISGGAVISPDASWSIAGAGDFNADGMSDLLWRNTNGSIVVWTMSAQFVTGSGSVTAGGTAVSLDASWSVAGIGDFDGDYHADILWRNASGEVATWFMSGSTIAGSADVTSGGVAVRPDASWSVAGIGDFDADGHADILWRNTSGSLVEWLMNGSTISSSGFVSVAGTPVARDASWHVVEIGDFNGDARTDMLWRSDSGALAEWLMNGTTITSSFAPGSGGTPVAPDASWQVQAKPTNFA